MRIEQIIRAGAAILGGFQLAIDHLRIHIDDDPTIPTIVDPCPLCPGSLADGPHFHDQDVVWPTMEDGVVLLTELSGGNPLVIPTSLPPEARA